MEQFFAYDLDIIEEGWRAGLDEGRSKGIKESAFAGEEAGSELGKKLGYILGTLVFLKGRTNDTLLTRRIDKLLNTIMEIPLGNGEKEGESRIVIIKRVELEFKRVVASPSVASLLSKSDSCHTSEEKTKCAKMNASF